MKDKKELPPKSQFGYSVELLIKLESEELITGYYSFRNHEYYRKNHEIIHNIVSWIALGEEELTTINFPI